MAIYDFGSGAWGGLLKEVALFEFHVLLHQSSVPKPICNLRPIQDRCVPDGEPKGCREGLAMTRVLAQGERHRGANAFTDTQDAQIRKSRRIVLRCLISRL